MVPLGKTLLPVSCWMLLAATLPAQTANRLRTEHESQLIRGGAVAAAPESSSPAAPMASSLSPPVLFDTQLQPASYQPSSTPETSTPAKTNATGLPLARKGDAKNPGAARPRVNTTPLESLGTVGGSLAVVIGLFLTLAWVTKRGQPKPIAKLPGEVIEVLGKTAFTKGQELQLVRVGGKLLLLCVTPHSAETLTEINDAVEVDRLSAVCRKNHPQGVSAAFDQMLASVGRESAHGFAEDSRNAKDRGARRYA